MSKMSVNNTISPTMLVVLDGFGYSDKKIGNATTHAFMPHWQFMLNAYPHTLLHASGKHVGLLPGSIGNSEVGHLTIGAGRVVDSVLAKAGKAIKDGSFFAHGQLQELLRALKRQGGRLHLMGLLSDGGVHSHQNILFALMQSAHLVGISEVFIHAFLDGRDVGPRTAGKYLELLEQHSQSLENSPSLASIHGRFFAMDRDQNWERTQQSYAVICGEATSVGANWQWVLEQYYAQEVSDEFIPPTLLVQQGSIKPGDGIIFFNMRPDRARQLTECFLLDEFHHFERKDLTVTNKGLTFFISGSVYNDSYESLGCVALYREEKVYDTLLDVIDARRLEKSVFIVAESEKTAHVTYFFKGLRDEHAPYETRAIVPSIKTPTYQYFPAMSAENITKQALTALHEGYFFYLVNYANADMVGHSGNFQATVQACEVLDQQLGVLYDEVVLKRGGTLFITADHGNAEEKIDFQGNPLTAHTVNKVPFVAIGVQKKFKKVSDAGLSSVAPTILTYLQHDVPLAMTGLSFL